MLNYLLPLGLVILYWFCIFENYFVEYHNYFHALLPLFLIFKLPRLQLTKSLVGISKIYGHMNFTKNTLKSINKDLKEASGIQSEVIESTTTTFKRVIHDLQKNTELTPKIHATSNDCHKLSEKGHVTIQELLNAMDTLVKTIDVAKEVNQSMREMKDKANLIDDIVLQTRMLALNAAIEAARFGETGKGFAVVSSEMQKLADQSSETVGTVKKLIDQSVDKVQSLSTSLLEKIQDGNKLTHTCYHNFSEIKEKLQWLLPQINEMTTAIPTQMQSIRKSESLINQINILNHNNRILTCDLDQMDKHLQQDVSSFETSMKSLLKSVNARDFAKNSKEDFINMQILDTLQNKSNQISDMKELIQVALDVVCEKTPWQIAHLFVLNGQSVLESGKLWNSQLSRKFNEFKNVSEKATFPIGEGLPGRVYVSKKPEWILDVVHHAKFKRAPVADRCGIKSAFAFPILTSSGEVLGIVEYFCKQKIVPSEKMIYTLTLMGLVLGQAAQRKRTMENLSHLKVEENASETRTFFNEAS